MDPSKLGLVYGYIEGLCLCIGHRSSNGLRDKRRNKEEDECLHDDIDSSDHSDHVSSLDNHSQTATDIQRLILLTPMRESDTQKDGLEL